MIAKISYCGQKLYDLGSYTAQEIQIGSPNFGSEIEGYLANTDAAFAMLGEYLTNLLSQVTVKLQENDGEITK